VYHGPRDVTIIIVADVKLVRRTDVLVRIATTHICGSDLDMLVG
jgi:threonine dehydrogenase-like Zn-dependent dehydrogenase